MTPKKPKARGTARMKELGYRCLQLWISPTMQAALERIAAEERLPFANIALSIIRTAIAHRQIGVTPKNA
jgi:hypothetical protein